ncbi:hypothetical protein A7K94_0216840 [Modestobacter sp. VKM Ac-2676]|nr:hypothetical protein A7K94_0216840 [Modestobacter sp. VKM Ac-2676]
MPIAPQLLAPEHPSLDTADAVSLLPTRAVLFDRISERAASTDRAPAALVLIGLLRRDNGWPMPGSQLDQVAATFSRSVRGDDWLARSGPAEFAFLLNGLSPDAEIAAHRLVDAVADEGIPGLTAAAGIAGLSPETSAGEVHRRATLCLTAARTVGAGQVIRYSGTRR